MTQQNPSDSTSLRPFPTPPQLGSCKSYDGSTVYFVCEDGTFVWTDDSYNSATLTSDGLYGSVGNYREGGSYSLELGKLLTGDLGRFFVDAIGVVAALHVRKVAHYVQLTILETGLSFEEIVAANEKYSQIKS